MDSTSFDFEKPIADLIEQREKVKQVAEKSKVDVSATLKEINHKIEKTRKEIFENLNGWQKVQISRHPERPYTLQYIETICDDFIEIEKDINRLETITERFSKIGSKPQLDKHDIKEVLQHAVDYMRTRTSRKIIFTLKSETSVDVKCNVALFEWVVENLIRNAADAMEGEGQINIHVFDQSQFVYIDIEDTGKGIPKSKFKTVFKPGYTTKKRGWGLGLSLTKRIIENYHGGKIFVKGSEIDKGTTFRIVLNK